MKSLSSLALAHASALFLGAALLLAVAAWGYAPPVESLPAVTHGQFEDPMLQQMLMMLGKVGGLARAGELFALAVVLVCLLVLGIRAFGRKLHEMIPDDHWADRPFFFLFESKPGGVLLNSSTAFALAVVPLVATDTPLTPELVFPLVVGTGGMVGLATALYGWVKDVVAWRKTRALQKAEASKRAAEVAKTGAVVLLLLLPFSLQSCTHAQVWRASGETVTALGEGFAATGAAMDSLLAAKVVTVEQYREWASFCDYFKPAYDLAFKRWVNSSTSTAKENAEAVLATLSLELAIWTAKAAEAKPKPVDGGVQ